MDVGSKFPGKEMYVNVFAKDAKKASKIYGVINPGKCRPK